MTTDTPKLGEVSTYDFGGHRLSSRGVSWNSTGQNLAVAASDRTTRICTLDGTNVRELSSLAGHSAPVDRVRFHPHQDSLLCTTASDSTVRIWDARSAARKAIGHLDLPAGSAAADISWSPATGSSVLVVAGRDGSIHLHDARKLPAQGGKDIESLKTFKLESGVVEACIFSPSSHHLVAATTNSGYGNLNIWNWEKEEPGTFVYPAHTGPIYSMTFSPDGRRLATGGSDAVIGIWDVESMVCEHVISRCMKFTRSVSFSHDSRFLASSSEEDGVDLAMADSGAQVGRVGLGRRGGADEISFHPKGYVVACARCLPPNGAAPAAVTVARITIEG